MSPSEWINSLMRRHGIPKPDGRPLYQYRITDDEYQELLNLLRLSSHFGFQNISGGMLFWDAVMVFYASEWWRRHYNGVWSWEGVFDSIGLDCSEITTSRRNNFVEVGLKRWGRDVRLREGRNQYLGTIATEGGLPLNQLVEAGGWLKTILGPVVKKHVSRNLPVDSLIEAYESSIPPSYRSSEIKQVLEDIVISVVALRNTHQLHEKEMPLDWLDNNVQEWWNGFPLPLDNDIARSLLRELIVIAGDSPAIEKLNPFVLERYLINVDFQPELQAKLDMPRYVLDTDLPGLDFACLPGCFELEVSDEKGISSPWCRVIKTEYKGNQALRLSGRTLVFSGLRAVSDLKLRFKSIGEVIGEAAIVDAASLESDIPWIFKLVDNHWLLNGVASQSVSDDETLVYIPDTFTVKCETETTTCQVKARFMAGQLFSLEGKVACSKGSEKYLLKTGAHESFTRYHLSGKLFDGVSRPADIFIGTPSLVEHNTLTGISKRMSEGRLIAKPVGVDTAWMPLNQVGSGHYEVRLTDGDGHICWRRRIGLLDDSFRYKVCPDKHSALSGALEINGCSEHIIAVQDDPTAQIQKGDSLVRINLSAKHSPPMHTTISILPDHHKNELRLKLPFPSSGALLFDPEGKNINVNSSLFLNSLHGYRIRLFDDRFFGPKKAQVRFSLIDAELPACDRKDMYIDKAINITSQVTELTIIDWQKVIQELLGVSRSLDAMVRVSLVINGQEIVHLTVRRYEFDLQPDKEAGVVQLARGDSLKLELEQIEGAKIQAFRLHQPEQQVFMLEPETSEGCHLGSWKFYPEKQDEGAWLICPTDESLVQFRPLLWFVDNDGLSDPPVFLEGVHSLQQAIRISDRSMREEALCLVMNQMANDLEHKSWNYLNNLWEVSKHLPLSTFDVWRVSVSEPEFLATLLVQGYSEVIERLEDELPILWELVRVSDWFKALMAYKDRYSKTLCGDRSELSEDDMDIIKSMVLKRIRDINNVSFSMRNMGDILTNLLFDETSKDLDLMQRMPIEIIIKPQIENALQDMLRRQSDSQWPELLGPQIRDIFSELPGSLQSLVNVHQNFKKTAAYLPVILAWRTNTDVDYGWLGRPVNIFKLEQIRNFDEEWFSVAFEFVSVWLSQHELTSRNEVS